ncbi:MAG: class I SAM-dependent methyltransferase [Acidobacteriia bacterium]|nr:class I SAM-dependent methyltransferase [Terriglobia bacterium]
MIPKLRPAPSQEFLETQARYFEEADSLKYSHQTRHPYIMKSERALLDPIQLQEGQKFLEVGCGEGGNLFFLRSSKAELFGIDLFPGKLWFAERELPSCKFVCCGVELLPFRDGTFDVVLCRDVLHHLPDREKALRELLRVCRPGGQIVIIEPNGKNPVIQIQIWLLKAERGIRRNSPESMENLLFHAFGSKPVMRMRQPLPVFRMVLHYRFGIPRVGYWKFVQKGFDFLNVIFEKIVPTRRWAFLVFEHRKSA